MIVINLDGEKGKMNLDAALKIYKAKHNKLKITKELNERKTFKKPSTVRRQKLIRAKYLEKKRRDESN